jgi:hypothetical protein
MFQKRKKFKEEVTAEKRMSDRWDQQIFFITSKFPDARSRITAIEKEHATRQGSEFSPSEEALADLANYYSELRQSF